MLLLRLLALASLGLAIPLKPRDAAVRNSQSGSYAPYSVACPPSLKVRQTTISGPLNPSEAAYIASRTSKSAQLWTTYLNGAGLVDFNISNFLPAPTPGVPVAGVNLPNVGIAVSGGGFRCATLSIPVPGTVAQNEFDRAMLTGGSMLNGFDNRNTSAVKAGTGGILQLANYITGLSGGSWCIGSWALGNFPTFQDMLKLWDMEHNSIIPPTAVPAVYTNAVLATLAKAQAGYPVSSVDVYGRLLSYHFFDDPVSPLGPGSQTLMSSIKSLPNFVGTAAPYPIFYTTGREPNSVEVSILAPRYEVTPVSFGLNHPTVGSIDIPIEYLGSTMSAGKVSSGSCVAGFENAGWLLGTSGNSITDPVLLLDITLNSTGPLGGALDAVASLVPDAYLDSAVVNNPFYGISPTTYSSAKDQQLYMLDGGASNPIVNLPLWPLLQPARKIDVIFAIDDSADTSDSWPNGAAVYIEYIRTTATSEGFGNYPFPKVPTPNEFVASKRNKRVSFLGSACQPDYATSSATKTPLVVYMPKFYVNYATNVSSTTTYYSDADQQGFFENGFAIASADSACFACAMIDAQMTRNKVPRSAQCAVCFQHYCFNA